MHSLSTHFSPVGLWLRGSQRRLIIAGLMAVALIASVYTFAAGPRETWISAPQAGGTVRADFPIVGKITPQENRPASNVVVELDAGQPTAQKVITESFSEPLTVGQVRTVSFSKGYSKSADGTVRTDLFDYNLLAPGKHTVTLTYRDGNVVGIGAEISRAQIDFTVADVKAIATTGEKVEVKNVTDAKPVTNRTDSRITKRQAPPVVKQPKTKKVSVNIDQFVPFVDTAYAHSGANSEHGNVRVISYLYKNGNPWANRIGNIKIDVDRIGGPSNEVACHSPGTTGYTDAVGGTLNSNPFYGEAMFTDCIVDSSDHVSNYQVFATLPAGSQYEFTQISIVGEQGAYPGKTISGPGVTNADGSSWTAIGNQDVPLRTDKTVDIKVSVREKDITTPPSTGGNNPPSGGGATQGANRVRLWQYNFDRGNGIDFLYSAAPETENLDGSVREDRFVAWVYKPGTEPAGSIGLRRFYNPTSNRHFYTTTSWPDGGYDYGYQFERIEAYIAPVEWTAPNLIKLYHSYNESMAAHLLPTDPVWLNQEGFVPWNYNGNNATEGQVWTAEADAPSPPSSPPASTPPSSPPSGGGSTPPPSGSAPTISIVELGNGYAVVDMFGNPAVTAVKATVDGQQVYSAAPTPAGQNTYDNYRINYSAVPSGCQTHTVVVTATNSAGSAQAQSNWQQPGCGQTPSPAPTASATPGVQVTPSQKPDTRDDGKPIARDAVPQPDGIGKVAAKSIDEFNELPATGQAGVVGVMVFTGIAVLYYGTAYIIRKRREHDQPAESYWMK